MIELKNYKTASNKSYIFLDLNDTCYTRKELLSKLPEFVSFMKTFNCSVSQLMRILKSLCVMDRELFEYTTFCYAGNKDFMVSENDVYTEKWKNGRILTTTYNVYITSYKYVSLLLNQVAEKILLSRFPFMFQYPFVKQEKLFKENITFPNKKTLIKKLSINSLSDKDITIEDFIKLYTKKDYKNSIINTSLFKVYANGQIFLELDNKKDYGSSLYMTYSELENNDWDSIANKSMFSRKGYVRQCELIDFNLPLIVKLKEMMNNN